MSNLPNKPTVMAAPELPAAAMQMGLFPDLALPLLPTTADRMETVAPVYVGYPMEGQGKLFPGAAERLGENAKLTIIRMGQLAVGATIAVRDGTVRTFIGGVKLGFNAAMASSMAMLGCGITFMVASGAWGNLLKVRDENNYAFWSSQQRSRMEAKDASLLACQKDQATFREKYLTARLQGMLVEKGLNVQYMWQPDYKENKYTVMVKGNKAQPEVYCYGNLHMEGDDLSPESVTDLECPQGQPQLFARMPAESTRSAQPKTAVAKKTLPSPTPTPQP